MLPLKNMLEVLHEDVDLSSADEIRAACMLIVVVQEKLTEAARDTLRALFKKGPLYDGDVPSKVGRDLLVGYGFAQKIVVKGEEGYNACTYSGARAYRLLEAGAHPEDFRWIEN